MGKRSKEKRLAESAGRRKQTIQLGGLRRHHHAPSYTSDSYQYGEYAYSSQPSAVSGIQLLDSYQEGSDDSGTESPITMRSSLPAATQPGHKMDDELAGFLAEINAIDTTAGSAPASTEPASSAVYDPLNFDPFTQGNLLPEPWQAVLDESSGYHYYWNCETNEVQWEPPPATAVQGCLLPEPPPPPPSDYNMAKSGSGKEEEQELQGSSLETVQPVDEEEERRKAMSAKLSGLSKKERIKLLLQMNKMDVDERPSEDSSKDEDEAPKNTEAVYKTTIEDVVVGAQPVVKHENEEGNPALGLVSGYDSEASEDDSGSGSVGMEVVVKKQELLAKDKDGSKLNGSVSTGPQLSSEALKDMQALFEETENLVAPCKIKGESDSKSNHMEIDVVKSSGLRGSIVQDKVSSSVHDDAEMPTMDDEEIVAVELKRKEAEDLDIKTEQSVETVRSEELSKEIEDPIAFESLDTKEADIDSALELRDANEGATDVNEKTGKSLIGMETDTGMEAEVKMETEVKMEAEVKVDTNVKVETRADIDAGTEMETGAISAEAKSEKEFSVDIFADETDHENDVVGVPSKSTEKDKETDKIAASGLDGTSKDVGKNREKNDVLKEDAGKGEHKEKDSDKKKKSKHKERKKTKKEKKEKKHKDHDKKHKDSEKKHKDEKSARKSKKHSEKSHNSAKTSRSSTEDSKGSGKSKEKELTEEEKLKMEEEKRKGILEEVEREERRRSEYERLKKEEKERKEEEHKQLEIEKKKQEEKKKEEEKLKEKEIHDFAEMLLEGALDEEKPEAETETVAKPEEPTEDDMDISDSDENQGKPPLPPMPPPDDDYNLQNSNQNDHYNAEMQSRITDLSLLLFDKLEYLEVSKKGLTNFQVMFIEMETRMHDWREGALTSEYLLYKLEEIDAEICKYEETAAPDGWSCHWSSEYGMYYYYCEETGESTWSYPTAKPSQNAENVTDAAYGPAYVPTGSAEMPSAPAAAPLEDYGYGRSHMMMWRSDLVENEKKEGEVTKAKKVTNSDPYRDPYRQSVSKKEDAKASIAAETPLPPGEDDENLPNPWEEDRLSGTSSPLPFTKTTAKPAATTDAVIVGPAAVTPVAAVTVAAAPINAGGVAAANSAESSIPTQLGTVQVASEESSNATIVHPASTLSSIPRVASDSALLAQNSLKVVPSASSLQNTLQPKVEKKKKEKRKKAVAGGLATKKLKTVSSLVQKWQQVKQQVNDELMEDSSEDEDPSVVSQKRIAEWKKAQLESGRAAYNPNFEEIKGDWREKIKKKRQ